MALLLATLSLISSHKYRDGDTGKWRDNIFGPQIGDPLIPPTCDEKRKASVYSIGGPCLGTVWRNR